MKIDLQKWDKKDRFYQFYISIERWSFCFAIAIARFEVEIRWIF